jgi:hypothetical protein
MLGWVTLIIQLIGIVFQCLGIVALILTVIVYSGQLHTMNKQLQTSLQQLDATRQGSNGQNILALVNFLQTEDIRAARTMVFQDLKEKHFTTWNEQEIRAASKVCSSYGVTGVILKTGVIPTKPFLENWGTSILRSFEILVPYIREMQKPENAGSQYWSTFEWLYQQVCERYPNLNSKKLDKDSD